MCCFVILMLFWIVVVLFSFFFFFNDTATTEIYTLSLHDALPILTDRITLRDRAQLIDARQSRSGHRKAPVSSARDRKSTRLNSSHGYISYAVFCLKKKKTQKIQSQTRLYADHQHEYSPHWSVTTT